MRSWKLLLPLLASSCCLVVPCFAAQPDRVPATIDSSRVTAVPRTVHPLARPQYDQGPVEDSRQFGYVTLVMAPTPTQQAALELLLAQQQDRNSPNFHKWLTPAQYADRFGLSPNDMDRVSAWLQSQGLQIVTIGGGRNSIVFSGTAGQIQNAFNTQIHHFNVNGEKHVANSIPLSVPAALSGVITNVRGIADFNPKPLNVPAGPRHTKGPRPSYTTTLAGSSGSTYLFAPGDVATMYDLNPLYSAAPAIDGTGQKLAIIGQTDIFLADLNDFRSGFGLSTISGCTTTTTGVVGLVTSCSTTNFQYFLVAGITDPLAPSTCGDLPEADLDLEWSGAIARNAQIVYVNAPATFNSDCSQLTNNGGVFNALAAAINPPSGPPLAPVMSLSYGLCEAQTGTLETELQQANAEGVTVVNSSGDTGAAACDGSPVNSNPPYTAAQYGAAVSYPASSPEVTGVGGTFIPASPSTNYSPSDWSSANGSDGVSLLNYIAELPWNDDEALAAYCLQNPSNSFCSPSPGVPVTSAQTYQEDYWISAGGGGVSNCWNEDVNAICLSGFAQPTWQQALSIPGLTSPQNTYRYVPDVSLVASPNFPGYVYCTPVENLSTTSPYDTETTSSCAGGVQAAADGTEVGGKLVISYSIVGGTSASSPIFAGIVTLMNQYLAASGGLSNVNPALYYIAAHSSFSAFHRIPSGDNDVYCEPGFPAGQPADVICPSTGVVGFSAANSDSASGYNLVNGLGSVDANQLAQAWAASLIPTATSLVSSTSGPIGGGLPVTLTATVTPSNAPGSVNFYVSGTTAPVGSATVTGGTAVFTTTALPSGTDSVSAVYAGNNAASASNAVNVTVTPPDFSLSASALSPASVPAGQSATATLTVTPVVGAGTLNFSGGSCSGLPTGATCSFSNAGVVSFGGSSATGTITVTIATTANMTVPSGAQTITISGTESGTGGTTHTVTVALTITTTNQSFTITPDKASYTISAGATAVVNLALAGTNGFVISSSNTTALPVTYTCVQSGLPSESSCAFSPTSGNSVSAIAVTLNIATTGPTAQRRSPLRRSPIFYALLLPGMFGVLLAAGARGRGPRLLGLIVVLGLSSMGLGSCGGSSNNSQKNGGTPAGTYTITVNATTAGPVPLTATQTVTLTVQ